MYISPERKVSAIAGTGVQYIPWHDEQFVDFVVEKYLPPTGRILDLGGGGLRFAIPAALKGKSVLVVDLDEAGLNIEDIVRRSNEFGKAHIKLSDVIDYIAVKVDNIFSFLEHDEGTYKLITAFRLMHFFSPPVLDSFFSLISLRLDHHGTFAFSGVTPCNTQKKNSLNEIYLNTTACDPSNMLYRQFNDTSEAAEIREKQNLSPYIHLINEEFIHSLADKYNFTVVATDIPSTKIVAGFILQKK
jgi:SAM-dependent methyltransferase